MNYLNTGIPGLMRLKNSRGYLTVMFRVREKKVNFTVHRLVAAAFIGPRPAGMHINHLDGVKSNNAVSNLKYVTPSENTLHSFALGLQVNPKGENHNQAKLTDDAVLDIKRRLADGERQSHIARSIGVSQALISLISSGKRWAHIVHGSEVLQ